MKKLSLARRRVVVMAAGLSCLTATSIPLEHAAIAWLHLPAAPSVLFFVTLQLVAIAYLVTGFARLKAEEAREAAEQGSEEA